MAVLTHLTTNDLYDMDFHAGRAGLRIGNFEALDLVHTLRHLVQEVERVKDMEDFIDDLKGTIHSLRDQNLELSVERDNLEDTVIELEQKLEKLEKEQANEGKVNASGWTEKHILKKGDKFTTPYSKGVQTYDPVGLTNIDGEEKTNDQ